VTSYVGAFAANITVVHEIWTGSGTTDGHGNAVMTYGNPISRQVIAVYPLHKLPHHDVVSSEYLARVMIDFIMEVPDATLYKKNDQVTWDGVMFLVQGFPFNWGDANPFGLDRSMFGGSVHIERVQ
jgi:hypothetical protein